MREMDKRTTIRRLETLATFLETKVPRKHFDMGSWVQHTSPAGDRTFVLPKGEGLTDCGAAACAFGWATTIPAFKRAGLRLKVSRRFNETDVTFGKARDFLAAQRFFGITEVEAERLFHPWAYANRDTTPKQVAKRIRKFVAELRAA